MQSIRRLLGRIDPYLLLLLVLTSLALTPLVAPGYFYAAHDGRHSVFYLQMFDASLRDGALWPRWAMHHIQGYGYPTFVIQAPLGFYLGELFVLLGAGFTTAAKLAWAVGFYAGAWGIYALVCHWFAGDYDRTPHTGYSDRARLAGLTAGLLYVFLPYHLVGIYVRAALNDTLLFAWFPWVLLAFDRLIVRGSAPGRPRRLALAALLLAGTLLTHTFALISFTPLLMIFVLFRLGLAWWTTTERGLGDLVAYMLPALAAGLLALMLYAGFLLPLLDEGRNLQQTVYSTGTYSYANHFVYLGQFFSPEWGFGFSDDPAGANDGMSFQVGVIGLILLIVAIYLLWREGVRSRALMLFLLVSTLSILLLMTPLAAPIWDALPALGIIQFPWRLLSLTTLTVAALGGLTVGNLMVREADPRTETGGALVLGLLIIAAGSGYVQAQLEPVEPWREDGRAVFRFEEEHPDMIALTQYVEEPFVRSPMSAEYASPEYREERGQTTSLTRLAVLDDAGTVVSSISRGSSGGGRVQMTRPGIVRLHYLYFPGWQAYVDGQPVPSRISAPHGLVEIDVPAGEHDIDLRMEATPARRTGALIAWSALAVTFILFFLPSGRGRRPGE